MRIARVHIVNFRCLRELRMPLDNVTMLVGANSTGKSSVLHALNWFFTGGQLTDEDISGHTPGEQISVGVTFTDFDDSDRHALGSYVLGDEASFWRSWSTIEGEKLTGKGRAFPAFAAVREHASAMPKRKAYNELREAQPELGLERITSAKAVDDALTAWEAAHPEDLEDGRTDATHLFGFTGQARLARRMDFVLVPAVSNPEEETRDVRGTLLRQLLDRALGEQSVMRERLAELEVRVSDEMRDIMVDEGGAALDQLSGEVTSQLVQLVPGSEVLLSARPPSMKVPSLTVDLRVADDGLDTAVGRQGHGFQRALLIAVVQQLAAVATAPTGVGDVAAQTPMSPSALMLALEEPELYQHPLQARHFAATLSALAEQTGAPVQVCYATHSEHFVDPAHYERLRRFRRRSGVTWPQSEVTQATVERVVTRLADAYKPEQIPLRVQLTLRRQVAESVFAKAVLIVEGDSDAGLLQGIADRDEGLDALGISIVRGHGKRQLLIPWAILSELGVPAFVVFDGDAGLRGRMLAQNKELGDAEAAQQAASRENEVVLKTLGVQRTETLDTHVGSTYAVFADTLETEATQWAGFDIAVQQAKEASGDFRGKSDDAYRQAALAVESEPPKVFSELLTRVRGLAI